MGENITAKSDMELLAWALHRIAVGELDIKQARHLAGQTLTSLNLVPKKHERTTPWQPPAAQ